MELQNLRRIGLECDRAGGFVDADERGEVDRGGRAIGLRANAFLRHFQFLAASGAGDRNGRHRLIAENETKCRHRIGGCEATILSGLEKFFTSVFAPRVTLRKALNDEHDGLVLHGVLQQDVE